MNRIYSIAKLNGYSNEAIDSTIRKHKKQIYVKNITSLSSFKEMDHTQISKCFKRVNVCEAAKNTTKIQQLVAAEQQTHPSHTMLNIYYIYYHNVDGIQQREIGTLLSHIGKQPALGIDLIFSLEMKLNCNHCTTNIVAYEKLGTRLDLSQPYFQSPTYAHQKNRSIVHAKTHLQQLLVKHDLLQ